MVDTSLVMAFDYGTKKIGVAVGQAITGTASPVSVLVAKDGVPDWQKVEDRLTEWQPSHLVIGLPLNMDDTPSAMSDRAIKFARRLTGRFNIPHSIVDERLSSFEAKQLTGVKSHQTLPSKRPLDAIAAKLILETWFRQNE